MTGHRHLMARFRAARRPGDEAYPGRFSPMTPERLKEMLAGPRIDERGQTWDDYNAGWTYEDWQQMYEGEPAPRAKLEWREGPDHILPHVHKQIDQHNTRWTDLDDENSFHNSFWPKATQQTAIRQHGETRYGLDVGDEGFDIGGWLWHWRLHRQVGPDIDDPEHWEQLSSLPGAPTADTAYDPEHAKAHAEDALDRWIAEKAKSRPAIGDYDLDDIMRQHDPGKNPGRPGPGDDFDYGDFGGRP